MGKLPKSIIQKYGISKKAWAVFRGQSRTTTRGESVARRSRVRHSRSRKSFGGGSMMSGMFKPSGILGAAVLGVGAALLSGYIPVNIPYKATIAGFLVGGVPGAAAAYLIGGQASNSGGSGITLN